MWKHSKAIPNVLCILQSWINIEHRFQFWWILCITTQWECLNFNRLIGRAPTCFQNIVRLEGGGWAYLKKRGKIVYLIIFLSVFKAYIFFQCHFTIVGHKFFLACIPLLSCPPPSSIVFSSLNPIAFGQLILVPHIGSTIHLSKVTLILTMQIALVPLICFLYFIS